MVIMNTNKRRELADSKYRRRAECEKAVEELNRKAVYPLPWASWTSGADEYNYLIEDENRLKRARHAVRKSTDCKHRQLCRRAILTNSAVS